MVEQVTARLSRRTLIGTGLATAVALPAATGLTSCLGSAWDDLPSTRLTLATGNPGGVFYRYGEALAEALDRRLASVTTSTRETNASVQNLRLVDTGRADVGLALGDAASDAVRGTGAFDAPLDVVALTRTYDSFVHLVVRADSPVTDVAGLRGRRVGLGAPGSGTRVLARRILDQADVALGEVTASSTPLEESAAALRLGELDGFFFVSGLPNLAIATLASQTDIRLVDLGRLVGDMAREYGPGYTAGPVPAATYDMPGAVETLSVKNYVVVHRAMAEKVAYAVTRVMFEEQGTVERLAPGVRQPNIGAAIFTSPLDLHPGAVRYYRERHP
jgi:TRAP transporter TAXI family solute receptor